MKRRSFVAGLGVGLAAPAIVSAEGAYPNRPVRYINPYPQAARPTPCRASSAPR